MRLYRSRRRFRAIEELGLRLPIDPSLPATEADIFWRQQAYSETLSAHVKGRQIDSERPFTIRDIAGSKRLLIGPSGTQHLVLKATGMHIQVDCSGNGLLFGDIDLTFQLPAFEAWRSRLNALDLVGRMAREPATGTQFNAIIGRSSGRLADILFAYDAYRNGFSYRETSVALFGARRTEIDWTGGGNYLKDRIRRLVRRGLFLVKGGYLNLLK